jgi:hypothetical protein
LTALHAAWLKFINSGGKLIHGSRFFLEATLNPGGLRSKFGKLTVLTDTYRRANWIPAGWDGRVRARVIV